VLRVQVSAAVDGKKGTPNKITAKSDGKLYSLCFGDLLACYASAPGGRDAITRHALVFGSK